MKDIIKKYTKRIVIIGILLLFCDFLTALPPYIVKLVVDIDFSREDIINVIICFAIIYSAIHLVRVFFKYIRDILINRTICKILMDIREKLFNKILNFKMITFNKYNSSEIYTRLTSDVSNLFDLFFGITYKIASNVLYIAFMVIMMFFANINLAIIGRFYFIYYYIYCI